MVEVPVDQFAIVGGSGKQLDVCRDGSREVIVDVNVIDGFGMLVRVKDVVVGWMREQHPVVILCATKSLWKGGYKKQQ